MEILYEGKFLNLVREGRWEFCERVNATPAAMIFACTAEGRVILVEEFRPPIAAKSICFPAGLVGDLGPEAAAEAAGRELEEETGYRAGSMRYLFTGPSSPGLTSEVVSFFLADELEKVGSGGGVDNENIIVHEIPMDEIDGWLSTRMAEGKSIDPRVYTGLYFLRQH